MSISRDLNDTANLRDTSDTTSQLTTTGSTGVQQTSRGDARDRAGLNGATAHPYAEGIIRFYRARTILDNDGAEHGWSRAWRYLGRLEPQDLPSASRRQFLELVYFMQEQDESKGFATGEFHERVRSIAQAIDAYVDEMNQALDV